MMCGMCESSGNLSGANISFYAYGCEIYPIGSPDEERHLNLGTLEAGIARVIGFSA